MAGGDKVALVTGASRGLGKACAIELARAGFRVAVTARTLRAADQRSLPGNLEETADAIAAVGGEALAVPMDLDDRATVVAGVQQVLDAWGRVDVLVNNAFYQTRESQALLVDMSMEHLDKQIRVNLLAPMFLAKLVLPQMLERGDGAVIDMVSGTGVCDFETAPAKREWGFGYGTSKIGMIEIAAMLASQYGEPRHPRVQRAAGHRAHRATGRGDGRRHVRRRRVGPAGVRGIDHRLVGHRTGGHGVQRGPGARAHLREHARTGRRSGVSVSA